MQHLKVTIHIRVRTADGRRPDCQVVWADSKQSTTQCCSQITTYW
jgi:hypothetical protein